jgi:hypothetical protein
MLCEDMGVAWIWWLDTIWCLDQSDAIVESVSVIEKSRDGVQIEDFCIGGKLSIFGQENILRKVSDFTREPLQEQ